MSLINTALRNENLIFYEDELRLYIKFNFMVSDDSKDWEETIKIFLI